jgi:hypothetical protein
VTALPRRSPEAHYVMATRLCVLTSLERFVCQESSAPRVHRIKALNVREGCQRQCRAVNVSKATLEGAFVDEMALLQPTPGCVRLVKDRILHVWEERRAEANERTMEQERRVKVIQQKLDRLDEAFLYSESIDLTSYGRQRDRLREELTLAQIDRHTDAVDELDVQGILAFAERILPRASDLCVQASLDYKQRQQQLFFPEGIAFDGNRFNRTAATAPLFNYLAPSESADEKMVSRIFASWNQLDVWLRNIDGLRRAA